MECPKCGFELQAEHTVCPQCGSEIVEKKSTCGKRWKLILASVAIAVLGLCLSAVVYWGVTGVTSFEQGVQKLAQLVLPKENNVYRKASYSVSDEKAEKTAGRVVATVGEEKLTNGLLQIFYWMEVYDYLDNYSYYAIYSGLDVSRPLDKQIYSEEGSTWQQYFLGNAIKNWHGYQALSLLAQEEGVRMDPELQAELDSLKSTLTQSVIDAGYTGIDALIRADMGPGCTYGDYENYMQIYYSGHSYLSQKIADYEISQDAIDAYFDAHAQELEVTRDSGDFADVRHILVAVEGGTEDEDGNVIYSQQEWDTCKAQAQALMDQWLAGEATEDSFAQLAMEHSQDTGSNANGGLYTSLDAESGFVPEFIDWYMDEARQPGDYGLLQTDYGYHVMYFSASEAKWVRTCREAMIREKTQELLNNALKQHPVEIEYKKIALGVVELNRE